MAINIKNLEEQIQKKAYAVTSNTPTSELGDIVEAALLATNSLREYDSADLLPTATSSNEKLAYIKKDNSIRFNNGTKWDSLVSGAAQAGAVAPSLTQMVQGTNYGFAVGGNDPDIPTSPPTLSDGISRYSFASDGNATDLANIGAPIYTQAGVSSSTHGYVAGGIRGTPGTPDASATNVIEKFNSSNTTDATDVGDLTSTDHKNSFAGTYSADEGFVAGGGNTPFTANIDKFPFASDANATDHGIDITVARYGVAGTSSATHGYAHGGNDPTYSATDVIDKFPFTSSSSATDVGNLLAARSWTIGTQSTSHGYSSGGEGGNPLTQVNTIQKYSFTTDGNATDVGDLTTASMGGNASSSTTHGYHGGGRSTPSSQVNIIQKWPFATDENATDVGDLLLYLSYASGNQN